MPHIPLSLIHIYVAHLDKLPKVGIVYSYSNVEADVMIPFLNNGYQGIIPVSYTHLRGCSTYDDLFLLVVSIIFRLSYSMIFTLWSSLGRVMS